MSDLPILIADDQRDVLEALRLLLKTEGMSSVSVGSPDAALEAVRGREFAAVLMDLNYTRDTTSGAEGMELLEKLRAIDANLPVVVMTAWGTIDLAVRAMRLGAGDFIEKPWENNRLMSILRNQVALGESVRLNVVARSRSDEGLPMTLVRVGLPGAFTYDGFHNTVLPLIPEVAATVDYQGLTGDEATGICCQEYCSTGDLIGKSDATQAGARSDAL